MKKEDLEGESDEEDDNWEDEESDEEDELTKEMSEERGGYVYLRHRDGLGRFASPYTDTERKLVIEMGRKIDKFCRDYSRKVLLPYNEKILLLRLVDDFSDKEKILDKNGFINPKVFHFKRLLYHRVLLDHPLKRSAFSLFISRMVDEGLVEKIKHGHKLYLRITKKGLDKVWVFYEEYRGESWRMP